VADRTERLVNKEGSLYHRYVGEDHEVTVWPMSYGKARVCFGLRDDIGYEKGYCYEDPVRAIEAAAVWDGSGDPLDGWHRNVETGRRRPGGDPAKEVRYW